MNKKIKLKNSDIKTADSKKKFNKELFNEVAPKYDFATIVLSFGQDKYWKKKLIGSLPRAVSPECLDIACGTGDISIMLLQKYDNPRVIGIDLNENMLDIAKEKNNKITFMISDMCSLGFAADRFDIVTGGYALRNAPDLGKALDEIYRVMKKNAAAVFLDFNKSHGRFMRNIQLFLLKLWGNIWGLLLHKNPDIYGYIADSLKNYPDSSEITDLLKSKGFSEIKYKQLFFGFTSIVSFKK